MVWFVEQWSENSSLLGVVGENVGGIFCLLPIDILLFSLFLFSFSSEACSSFLLLLFSQKYKIYRDTTDMQHCLFSSTDHQNEEFIG